MSGCKQRLRVKPKGGAVALTVIALVEADEVRAVDREQARDASGFGEPIEIDEDWGDPIGEAVSAWAKARMEHPAGNDRDRRIRGYKA